MSATRISNITDIPMQMMFTSKLMSSSSEDLVMDKLSSFSIRESDTLNIGKKQGLNDPGSEICTKYIKMSDSSVFRHPYYEYPKVKDPGILEALIEPEESKVHSVDGQDLYLDLCEEMKVTPVRSFHRGLLKDVIDLKYYGVNPVGVRAMSMALVYNKHVNRLDLTSNFLDEDACFHLGQMLRENVTLQELILSGCRVGPEGIRRLAVFLSIRPLDLLDLSRNELGDEGFQYLADQIFQGAVIKRLNLSYNNLGTISALAFATAVEKNKSTSCLDLSWNKLSVVSEVISQLADSNVLEELNLSRNALKGNRLLRKLLAVPTLRSLDLSNNRLTKIAITSIANNLHIAKSLRVLNVSNNPLTPEDAFNLVSKLRSTDVKLTHLLMDNVVVNKEFVKEREEVLELSFREACEVTYGHVIHDYTLTDRDIREIVFKRLNFLTSRARKCQLDIAIYFLQKKKAMDYIPTREMLRDMKTANAPINENLIKSLVDIFPGPKIEKVGMTIDLNGVVDFVSRMWPEKKLPPTPPLDPVVVESKKKRHKNPMRSRYKAV